MFALLLFRVVDGSCLVLSVVSLLTDSHRIGFGNAATEILHRQEPAHHRAAAGLFVVLLLVCCSHTTHTQTHTHRKSADTTRCFALCTSRLKTSRRSPCSFRHECRHTNTTHTHTITYTHSHTHNTHTHIHTYKTGHQRLRGDQSAA